MFFFIFFIHSCSTTISKVYLRISPTVQHDNKIQLAITDIIQIIIVH